MLKRKSAQRAIPEPTTDPAALYASVDALKEVVETLAGQRGRALDVAVTWADLVEAGLIQLNQVPTNVGG